MSDDAIPKNYLSTDPAIWTGRNTNPAFGIQYWYQAIECLNLFSTPPKESNQKFGLLGYAVDEGVRRNQGRPGAKLGPNAIRTRLGKLSYHHDSGLIKDFGNIICQEKDLEEAQNTLALSIEKMIKAGIFPIVLGGGHSVALGHFKGLQKGLPSNTRIGILNFDAHFDLRRCSTNGNSGTPFYQIFEAYESQVEYFALGIQRAANPKQLFDIANDRGVTHLDNFQCHFANIHVVIDQILPFIERNDFLYISIDLDGFSSAYAPGVSAPSPLGFEPNFVFPLLEFLLNTRKVIACDIAELNPYFDIDQTTANLAARLVDWIIGN